MSDSGRDALLDVWEWSGGPRGFARVVGRSTGCLGVVVRPLRMSGSGLVALPDDREWSGGSPSCPGVVGRSTKSS